MSKQSEQWRKQRDDVVHTIQISQRLDKAITELKEIEKEKELEAIVREEQAVMREEKAMLRSVFYALARNDEQELAKFIDEYIERHF